MNEDPDIGTVEALCVLQLAARRLGCTFRISDADERVRELISLAGLDEALIDPPAGAFRLGANGPGAHEREET